MLKVLVLAAGLGQSTGSALTQSMDSELAQRGRALNTIDPSPTPPPIPPPIAPPIPPPLTCPEAKPDGACEPALAGLTCEYGPVWCSCPIECQPCGAEEKSCVNSTKATCREEPGGDSDTRWSIVISEPLAPPCPPPAKSPKPPPSPESPPPSPPSSPPPQPPPSPPPPSPPPFQCPDLTLHTRGWQMVSFYCAGTYIEYRTLNDIMKGIPFEADDQILLRHPQDGLVFATFTGTTWVGNLVKRGLSYNRGYMVRYSGPLDAVINQTGYPGIPGGYVEKPVLKKGWNYIGHATCLSYNLNFDIIAEKGQFSIDDRFRTRSLSTLLTANFDGEKFQGSLKELEPGVGYEVFVAKDVTFKYKVDYKSDGWRCK